MLLRRLFHAYERSLHARPLSTKAWTSALIGGAGDLTCQSVIDKHDTIDWRRCFIFTALGGVMVAPALHYWFSWLHRTLPGESVTAVGRRLLIDQFMFAPCFIPSFMATLHLLEGSAQPLTDAQTKWWDTVQANWRLWVPAQLINFGLVPVHFQVLFANGVAVFWNVYLSWATHSTASAVVAADADKA